MNIANGTPDKIAKAVTPDRPTASWYMIKTEVHAAILKPQNTLWMKGGFSSPKS